MPQTSSMIPIRWRFLALNIGFWSVIAFLFAIQASSRPEITTPFYQLFSHSMASFAPCMILTPAIATVSARYRFAPGQRPSSSLAHSLALMGFLVLGGALMGALEWLLPWSVHGGSIGSAAEQAITRYLASDVLIYIVVAMAIMAFVYARESQARAVAAAALQGQLAEARLHVLNAQLQPHFLFNTLNAISALVRDDPPQAERLLARLSELLRHALRDGAQPETSLDNEFAFLEKYVELQEARFGPRLKVTFEVDPGVLDARVPCLILQPLLENAIRHGIGPRSGPGSIAVAARRQGDQLRLSVRDDGIGMPNGDLQEGVGLRTTRARLGQLYGNDHQFTLVNQPDGGVACTLLVPLRLSANGVG
jgi:signal transduction histidine kinase